jgi:hypothetical protein
MRGACPRQSWMVPLGDARDLEAVRKLMSNKSIS